MAPTKLQTMLGEALGRPADSPEVTAVIEASADWFDCVLEEIGLQPNVIPTLLRWQYLQGEFIEDD